MREYADVESMWVDKTGGTVVLKADDGTAITIETSVEAPLFRTLAWSWRNGKPIVIIMEAEQGESE